MARTRISHVRATEETIVLELCFVFAQFRDHAEIFQRGYVTFHFAVRSQFTQQAPHDLAASRLGQHVGEANLVGTGQRADFLHHPLAQFLF